MARMSAWLWLKTSLQIPGVAVAQELVEDGGDEEALHVRLAPDAQDVALQALQGAGAVGRAPEAARRREEVEVGPLLQVEAHAGHQEAGLQQGEIEAAPVEGDQHLGLLQQPGHPGEHGPLLAVGAHQALLEDEARPAAGRPGASGAGEVAQADQEGVGAGAPGEAGGLGVQEQGALQGDGAQLRGPGEGGGAPGAEGRGSRPGGRARRWCPGAGGCAGGRRGRARC